jgi:hypothetical protein
MGADQALFSAAREELHASLERLPADALFQIVVYNRGAEVLRIGGRTELVAATPANKQQAVALVDALAAEGGTNHANAFQCALPLHPDVIFFLTDAADMTAQQIQDITLRNRGRTAIHTIELNPARRTTTDQPLALLAQANGGSYQPAPR